MKVKELIKKLEKVNPDLFIYVPKLEDKVFPEYQLANTAEESELGKLSDESSEFIILKIE